MIRPFFQILLASAVAAFVALPMMAQGTRHKEISLGHEREISVVIDVSFGTVIIEPGETDKILVADFTAPRDEESEEFHIKYSTRGDRGELVIKSKDRSKFWRDNDDKNIEDRVWTLRFSDALPMDFRIELGAGKGELDLTGLRIRTLKISSGASSVEMFCDKKNPIEAESIVIESGVSKFTATNLANMNFSKLKFGGGVGSYRLDFGGKLRRNADARVEVGLGAITIDVPRETPLQILYDDSWFSSFDLADGFTKRRGGVYETEDYRRSEPSLSIKVESGLGSVKVRRR
ncbi:MAG: toast rack family protein [Bacteroidota bacterium]